MRQQALKPYTIIPSHLYVERAADRQLRQIIDDMGRPGHVLVARQMGKTNLLLNAKRQLENVDDRFCYVDVSNFIPDLRTFFRAISDTCAESLGSTGERAKAVLHEARLSSGELLPHKEHELELRAVLRLTSGKLVICLDEIDALTKTSYSDQVFSLIRSIYFSGRTNFQEFSRLTYILSGVAEPSEIIKNRAISPFNISEKIYLEDFSRAEFDVFLGKSGLVLEEPITERIYYWAGGNPRITWDLCAAIEQADSEFKSSADIDELVTQLYLRSYDLPPVDHIRALAESDKDIRQAVMSIHYDKASAVPDSVRNRLYLAGITSIDHVSGKVRIKNKILEESLSEKWLTEIDRKTISVRDHARSLFEQERYEEALRAFEEFEVTASNIDDLEIFLFQKGSCQFFLGRYEDAIESMERAPVRRSSYKDLHLLQLTRIGLAHLKLANYNEAVETLRRVVDDANFEDGDARPFSYFEACIYLSTALLEVKGGDASEIERLCTSVIDSLDSIGNEVDGAAAVETLDAYANYTMARARLMSGDRAGALSFFERSSFFAKPSMKVVLLLAKAEALKDMSERARALASCVRFCSENRIAVVAGEPNGLLQFTADVAQNFLEQVSSLDKSDTSLGELIDHLSDVSIGHIQSIDELALAACLSLFHKRGRGALTRLVVATALRARRVVPSEHHQQLMMFASWMATGQEAILVGERFVLEYVTNRVGSVGATEFRALHAYLSALIDANSFDRTEELIAFARDNLVDREHGDSSEETHQVEGERLVLRCLELVMTHRRDGRVDRLLAQTLSEEIRRCGEFPLLFFAEDQKSSLLGVLKGLATRFHSSGQLVRDNPKIGRNQIVVVELSDGTSRTGKYKRFEEQIRSGEARLKS